MAKYCMVTLILFVLFNFSNCETPQGHSGASENIIDSKIRGVFIAEYRPPLNPIKINDTIKITVREAWIEHKWVYTKDRNGAHIINGKYQLCINTLEQDIAGVDFDWSIGIDFEKNMRSSGKNSLIGDFNQMPTDSIVYKVQKGNELSDNYEKLIIGELILIRKPLTER